MEQYAFRLPSSLSVERTGGKVIFAHSVPRENLGLGDSLGDVQWASRTSWND